MTAPVFPSSSATETALRLLQASSCFRPGAACGSLPCACAQSLVDALSPTQIAGRVRLAVVKILRSRIQASSPAEDVAPSVTNAEQVADLIFAAISPQAQAGETRETAEAWVWKDGIPAPAQEAPEPVGYAYGNEVQSSSSDWFAVKRQPDKYHDTPVYASPPAALPAGQVVVTPEMVSAGMAEIPEDGAEYEHVEAAYRKMAALAIPSTDREGK